MDARAARPLAKMLEVALLSACGGMEKDNLTVPDTEIQSLTRMAWLPALAEVDTVEV
jgi:hypothetical protein